MPLLYSLAFIKFRDPIPSWVFSDLEGELIDILNKIVRAKNEEAKLTHQAKLDELITLVQFANDEGDYGEGLELGLDLLAFHSNGNLKHILCIYLLINASS